MKNLSIKVLIVLALFFSSPSYSQVPLKEVIDVTKEAIFNAAKQLSKQHEPKNLPKLSNVELTLEVAIEKEANGTIKIYVLSAGADRSKTKSQKVTVNLTPDFDAAIDISSKQLGADLTKLIVETSNNLATAGDGKMAMKVKNVDIEVGLEIVTTGKGEVGFDIGIVNIGAGGSVAKTSSNTVKLTFGE